MDAQIDELRSELETIAREHLIAARLCIWLPILVPAAVIGVAHALELRLADGVVREILVYSLFYGGAPYAVLAIWSTWWVGGRSESEIRWLMFRAPLLMAGFFLPLALAVGFAVGAPRPFAAVALLGVLIILPLGSAYVGLAVLVRRVAAERDRRRYTGNTQT